jgi:hypothetical protein
MRSHRLLTSAFVLLLAVYPTASFAECDFDQFIGFTLLAKKTIEGFIEKGEKKDEFSGCDFDRIIVFTDQTGVRCAGYGYQYAYRPNAYLWSDGISIKMCVGSSIYSVKRLQ